MDVAERRLAHRQDQAAAFLQDDVGGAVQEVVAVAVGDGRQRPHTARSHHHATGQERSAGDGRALVAGYKCGLGKIDYATLTADLRKFDQKTCVVSNSRLAAKTTKGTTMLEVACADGFKGYMIEYQSAPAVTAVQAIGCAFAGNCKLPGNT